MPLSVLHVVVNMNRGGAETSIMNLYRHMDRQNVQFDFLTCKPGVYDDEIKQLGGRIYRIPYVDEAGHHGFIQALDEFFKCHHDYKIVHAHMDKMSGFVLRSAQKAHIPVRIAHSHSTASEGGFLTRTYKQYAGRLIKSSGTHLFACSPQAADWLFKKKAHNSHILKNGIDITQFQYDEAIRRHVRSEWGITENTLVLGHVGRFNKPKNHAFLIELFTAIHRKMPDSMLVMAGDGILQTDIQNQVKDRQLTDHVKFLGVRDDVPRLLQAFDLFLFPSLHEGFPVTLVEAQGASLPCVVADTITTETDLGLDLVHRLPLAKLDVWVETVQLLSHFVRAQHTSPHILKKCGYDIRQTAQDLQATYLSYGGEASETVDRVHAHI